MPYGYAAWQAKTAKKSSLNQIPRSTARKNKKSYMAEIIFFFAINCPFLQAY